MAYGELPNLPRIGPSALRRLAITAVQSCDVKGTHPARLLTPRGCAYRETKVPRLRSAGSEIRGDNLRQQFAKESIAPSDQTLIPAKRRRWEIAANDDHNSTWAVRRTLDRWLSTPVCVAAVGLMVFLGAIARAQVQTTTPSAQIGDEAAPPPLPAAVVAQHPGGLALCRLYDGVPVIASYPQAVSDVYQKALSVSANPVSEPLVLYAAPLDLNADPNSVQKWTIFIALSSGPPSPVSQPYSIQTIAPVEFLEITCTDSENGWSACRSAITQALSAKHYDIIGQVQLA